jgi:hypothetical protein
MSPPNPKKVTERHHLPPLSFSISIFGDDIEMVNERNLQLLLYHRGSRTGLDLFDTLIVPKSVRRILAIHCGISKKTSTYRGPLFLFLTDIDSHFLEQNLRPNYSRSFV